jgi:hypothetical protein
MNLNLCTISIEHVDPALDNSTPVPLAQELASFALVADICKRHGIAATDIHGHNSIDPVDRARCPGNYPMDELRAYVQAKLTPLALTASGEIAAFLDVSQFEAGESAFESVAFTAALCKYMGKPAGKPSGSPEDIDKLADEWYTKFTGSNTASNTTGMTFDQLHTMLDGIGIKWRSLPIDENSLHYNDIANVKTSLYSGKPVLISAHEDSFYDLDLGDKVPYGWPPTGNHCVVATGVASDGNLLIRDPGNVDAQGKIRPGPRRYDINKMFLISGTEIQPGWIS